MINKTSKEFKLGLIGELSSTLSNVKPSAVVELSLLSEFDKLITLLLIDLIESEEPSRITYTFLTKLDSSIDSLLIELNEELTGSCSKEYLEEFLSLAYEYSYDQTNTLKSINRSVVHHRTGLMNSLQDLILEHYSRLQLGDSFCEFVVKLDRVVD